MAFSLGALIVDLEARTGKFETDMGRAAGIMKKRAGEIDRQVAALARSFAVMATGAAVAIGAMITRSIKAADETLELAQALGTTVEQFSALRYAASLAGVSQEELETGLRKLASTAVDAATNIEGAAAKSFIALGVSVRKANGDIKSIDELLVEISQKFSEMPDGILKTSLAADFFSRAGSRFIPFLNEGSKGLEALTQEAKNLGLVLSTETAQAADQFNDNLLKLKGVASGFGNLLAAELLIPLTNLTEALIGTAAGTDKLKGAAAGVAVVIKGLAATAIIVSTAFQQVGKWIAAVAASLSALHRGEFKQALNIMGEFGTDLVGDFESSLNLIDSIFDDTAVKLEAKAPVLGGKIAAPAKEAAKQTKAAVLEMERWLNIGTQMSNDAASQMNTVYPGSTQDSGGVLGENTQAIGEAMAKIREDTLEIDGAFISVGESAKSVAETLKDESLRQSFTAISDLVYGMGEGMDDFAKSALDAFRRILANSITQQLFELLGSLGGGGTAGGFAGFIGKIFSGFGGPKAAGGPVSAGRSYLVGEHGPETFVPGMSGSIVPNHAFGGVTYAPVNNINIDSRSDRAAVQQDVMAIVTESNRRMLNHLQDQRSRGR